MKWIVTSFEPFNGAAENSSIQILEPIKKMDWQGRIEFPPPLPVEFGGSWAALEKILKPGEVRGVLALGQAETRSHLSLECLAHNWRSSSIKDNAGNQPGPSILVDGPDVLHTPIPWSRLVARSNREISHCAGQFVCNELMYKLLSWVRIHGGYGGFIHIPLLQGLVTPSHPMVESLVECLNFILQLKSRINVVAGIIENSEGRVLLARRPEGKPLAGLWEFPGGKLERGEGAAEALKRELKEELQLDVSIKRDLGEFDFEYDWGALGLRVFVVRAESKPSATDEVREFIWLQPADLKSRALAPADVEPLNVYLATRT